MDATSVIGLLANFLSLSFLEIILSVDNIVFVSLLVGKLPGRQAKIARIVGLGLAMIFRILMLFLISWIARLNKPLFYILDLSVDGRALIFFFGGLFLIYKSFKEIAEEIKVKQHEPGGTSNKRHSFFSIILQIIVVDVIFSLDSIITAIGISDSLYVIVLAMLVAISVILLASSTVTKFISIYPTLKMLALAFILLIGIYLLFSSLGVIIPKEYIYFGIGFSLVVESLNIWRKQNIRTQAEIK